MYAIIQESGGQRKVQTGDEILVDLISDGAAAPGQQIVFDRVLVVGEVGGNATLGTPYVKGASVSADVVESLVLGEKIDVIHQRPKKTWKKKIGHRQKYTKVRVTAIKA